MTRALVYSAVISGQHCSRVDDCAAGMTSQSPGYHHCVLMRTACRDQNTALFTVPLVIGGIRVRSGRYTGESACLLRGEEIVMCPSE